jgi:hypothetical protein
MDHSNSDADLSARQRMWVVRFSNETGLTAKNESPPSEKKDYGHPPGRTYARVL